jgi:EmrB/QacA subfamily drug resistance transporter
MITRATGIRQRDGLRRWIALLVVCFGQLMIVLDATIVNVALPTIQRDLGFSQPDLTWVVDAYAVSYAGFVLLAGRMGDLVGRKNVFLAGVLLFTFASAICGLAPSPALLVAARFAQGLGGALSAGVIIAIIVTAFREPDERAQAMSVFAFTLAAGGSLGLLAGGFLTQSAGWHWVFFINVPIGLATLLAGAVLIDDNDGAGLRQGVDVGGSVLVTAALMLGVYSIVTAAANGWTSVHTLGFGAASTLLLAGFVALQARLANPIMPLRILSIRTLAGASAARGLLATGMFTTFFLGALYLHQLRGYSALETGLAFLPFTLANGAMSIGVTGRLVGRFGARPVLVAGLLCITAALLMHSSIGAETSYFPELFVTYGLFGLGAGISLMPLTLLAMAEVPAADAGLASGITNVSMQVSAALGLAALGTIAADRSHSLLAAGVPAAGALTGGYQLAFTIAAVLVAAAAIVALLALRSPQLTQRADVRRVEEAAERERAA